MSLSIDYVKEVNALRQRVQDLEYELSRTKAENRKTWLSLVRMYKLTAQEAKLLACMLDGKIKTYDQLYTALDSEAFGGMNLCNVVLYRVRKKIPWAEIGSLERVGKQLSKKSADRINRELEEHLRAQ